MILIGLTALIGLLYAVSLFGKSSKTKTDTPPTVAPKTVTAIPTIQVSEAPVAIPHYSIDLPIAGVSIQAVQAIRETYAEYKKEGGCPGTCSFLIEGDMLEKQFALLTKVAALKTCVSTPELESEIKSFKLFDTGISSKKITGVIFNKNLNTCGIKFAGPDGYDASLGNYSYKAGFIKDGLVIRISGTLFPTSGVPETEALWKSFGYVNDMCDSICYENEVAYMQKVQMTDPLIKNMIAIYDSAVESFRFVN